MTELKTLKDIKHLVEREEGLPDYEAVDILTLRAEAVKWIKGFDNSTDFEGFTDYGGEITSWIKHFFNITEEDLEAKSK